MNTLCRYSRQCRFQYDSRSIILRKVVLIMDENRTYTDPDSGTSTESAGTTQQSANGNGAYEYGQSSDREYHSAYSNSYESNPQGGSNHYDTGNGNRSGANGNGGRKKGKGGKAVLAVLLAVIFGVSVGAGAVGISRAVDHGSLRGMNSGDEATEPASDSEENDEEASDTDDTEDSATDSDDDGMALDLISGDEINTAVTKVAEDVMPSIVSVYNNFTATSQDFFGQTYEQEGQATGSGIIIGKTDGELLIATNNHVVEGEDSLEVQFIDESTADANLKGTDSSNDLAVIAVKLKDIDDDTQDQIKIATLGDSDALKVGEPVVAIGNALGYGQSVTTGVVSALNREIDSQDSESGESIYGTFIQTDAAINPGNSGGALVDLNGNVIGINSSKIGGSTVEGMGYAIPMSKAAPIIEDLMNQSTKEKVAEKDKGYLGISGVTVTSQASAAYNMPVGVFVAEFIKGGAAEDSDLQKGDIITKLEGTTISTMEELQKQLQYYAAGQEVTLTVQRDNGHGEYSEESVKIKLGDASTMKDSEDNDAQKNDSHRGDSDDDSDQKSEEQKDADADEDSSADENDDSSQGDTKAPEERSDSQDSFGFYDFPWNRFGW